MARAPKDFEMQDPHGLAGKRDGNLESAIGREVRTFRRQLDMTVAELARQAGLSAGMLSKIENGKAMPTLSSLERLATALEVDMCNLLHDARNRQHDESYAVLADPFLSEIAPLISKLDALQRSMFLNQVRDMAMGRRRTAVA